MRRPWISAAALALSITPSGCDNPEPIAVEETIEVSEVPEVAMAAARRELPGVEFDVVYLGEEAGSPTYELRGQTAEGKVREVKVSAEGKVLETE